MANPRLQLLPAIRTRDRNDRRLNRRLRSRLRQPERLCPLQEHQLRHLRQHSQRSHRERRPGWHLAVSSRQHHRTSDRDSNAPRNRRLADLADSLRTRNRRFWSPRSLHHLPGHHGRNLQRQLVSIQLDASPHPPNPQSGRPSVPRLPPIARSTACWIATGPSRPPGRRDPNPHPQPRETRLHSPSDGAVYQPPE